MGTNSRKTKLDISFGNVMKYIHNRVHISYHQSMTSVELSHVSNENLGWKITHRKNIHHVHNVSIKKDFVHTLMSRFIKSKQITHFHNRIHMLANTILISYDLCHLLILFIKVT